MLMHVFGMVHFVKKEKIPILKPLNCGNYERSSAVTCFAPLAIMSPHPCNYLEEMVVFLPLNKMNTYYFDNLI